MKYSLSNSIKLPHYLSPFYNLDKSPAISGRTEMSNTELAKTTSFSGFFRDSRPVVEERTDLFLEKRDSFDAANMARKPKEVKFNPNIDIKLIAHVYEYRSKNWMNEVWDQFPSYHITGKKIEEYKKYLRNETIPDLTKQWFEKRVKELGEHYLKPETFTKGLIEKNDLLLIKNKHSQTLMNSLTLTEEIVPSLSDDEIKELIEKNKKIKS